MLAQVNYLISTSSSLCFVLGGSADARGSIYHLDWQLLWFHDIWYHQCLPYRSAGLRYRQWDSHLVAEAQLTYLLFAQAAPFGSAMQGVGYVLMASGGPFGLFVAAYVINGFGLGLQVSQFYTLTHFAMSIQIISSQC